MIERGCGAQYGGQQLVTRHGMMGTTALIATSAPVNWSARGAWQPPADDNRTLK
jgi:hypothetical protein